MHERLLVLLHQILRLLLANEHILEIPEVELLGLVQPDSYLGVSILVEQVLDELVVLLRQRHQRKELILSPGRCTLRRALSDRVLLKQKTLVNNLKTYSQRYLRSSAAVSRLSSPASKQSISFASGSAAVSFPS